MKNMALLILFSLLFTACGKKTEISINPLSKMESQALRTSLYLGIPVEDVEADSDECKSFQAEIPADFVQGFVTVPEDYAIPRGRQIKVFYYGRLQAGKDPIVFFNGGPASDSHSSSHLIESLPGGQKLSFVYIDQRGTGCSEAFPQEPANLENVQRLIHYTSTEIVKDSEVVREKLLGKKSQWKIFGQSYGGMIVHRYSLTAPQSIKGAFAHGFSIMNDPTQWMKLRIKSQKRVSELYFQVYPNDRDKLAKIRSLIAEDLCFNDGTTKICGPKVLDALIIFLGFSNSWSRMHTVIAQLIDPVGELDNVQLEQFVRNYTFGVFNSNGLAANVISVVEMSNGDSDSVTCGKVLAEIAAEGDDPQTWLLNECRLLAGMQNDQWAPLLASINVHLPMTPSQLKTALIENPKLPFYLYAGEKDVFVPFETFAEEIASLGDRINYTQFPKTGHEGFYVEQKVWDDIVNLK